MSWDEEPFIVKQIGLFSVYTMCAMKLCYTLECWHLRTEPYKLCFTHLTAAMTCNSSFGCFVSVKACFRCIVTGDHGVRNAWIWIWHCILKAYIQHEVTILYSTSLNLLITGKLTN